MDLYTIKTDTHVRYEELDTEVGPDDHWMAVVHDWDLDSEYKWDMEFLSDTEWQDEKLYNIVDVEPGDILRHKTRSRGGFFRVTGKSREGLELEGISSKEAIEHFGGDPEEVRGRGLMDVDLRLTGEESDVRDAMAVLDAVVNSTDLDLSFADEVYEMDDTDRVQVYGDIDL